MMVELLWITNLPAPYRLPLWEQLPTSVLCMASNEPNRSWSIPRTHAHYVRDIHAPRLTLHGQRVIYFPNRKLHRAITARPRRIVVDGWESPAYIYAILLGRALGIPVYLGYRASEAHTSGPCVRFLRRRLFKLATGVLSGSPATSRIVRSFGVPAARIHSVDNVVDVAALSERAGQLRKGMPHRPGHTFVFVGQLIARKNVEVALRGFAELADARDRFVIVGEGPEELSLRQVAISLGVEEQCEFWGGLPEGQVVNAYAAGDTLLLPSTKEIWGLVVAEALACGLHVVVSDSAGCVDVVREMPGVYVAAPVVKIFARRMSESRKDFRGHIDTPAMLAYTPARAAQQVLDALGLGSS